MKATIRQAQNNERHLTILPSGCGHWKITATIRGKRKTVTTSDSRAVDDFNSDGFEKDRFGCNRRKKGYETILSKIING